MEAKTGNDALSKVYHAGVRLGGKVNNGKKFSWGYDPYFFFSAYYSVDRTYAEKLKDINYETPHIVLEEISRNGDGDRFNQKILNKIINENS